MVFVGVMHFNSFFFFNGGMISVFQWGNFDFISFAAPELVF